MDLRAPFASPILRVLFDLARDHASSRIGGHGAAEVDEVVRRVLERLPARGDRDDLAPLVRVALRLLERSDLVQFVDHDRVRLTMTGFTLAVASPRRTVKTAPAASTEAPIAAKGRSGEGEASPAAVAAVLPVDGSSRPANRGGSVVAA